MNNIEKLHIGIDLGGTNIAAGLINENGTVLGSRSVPTPGGTENIISAMERLCKELMNEDVSSIGIGVPGTVWPRGTVSHACNIGMRNVPLADIMSEKLKKPVYIENDANCAALGEYLVGCGKNAASLLCVTIGTGVGGGYVKNGRLFRGFNGCGLEIGHMVIDQNGRKCACGRHGCFETLASTSALITQLKRYIADTPESPAAVIAADKGLDGHTVFLAMDSGDDGAGAIFEKYIHFLACGLTNLVNIFQPEVLCLGGGISAQGERLLAPVLDILEKENYARECEIQTRLITAQLGNAAGLIGAALLERTERNE